MKGWVPVAKRRPGFQTPATVRTSARPRHFRRGRGFVDEDQPMCLLAQSWLAIDAPAPSRPADVIVPAFRCHQGFFISQACRHQHPRQRSRVRHGLCLGFEAIGKLGHGDVGRRLDPADQ